MEAPYVTCWGKIWAPRRRITLIADTAPRPRPRKTASSPKKPPKDSGILRASGAAINGIIMRRIRYIRYISIYLELSRERISLSKSQVRKTADPMVPLGVTWLGQVSGSRAARGTRVAVTRRRKVGPAETPKADEVEVEDFGAVEVELLQSAGEEDE
jgi:hypothetical protein